MKIAFILIALCISQLSCVVLTNRNNKVWLYKTPLHFKTNKAHQDSATFFYENFSYNSFRDTPYKTTIKRSIQFIKADEIKKMTLEKDKFLIYFMMPSCGATERTKDIQRVDSIAKSGLSAFIISLENEPYLIVNKLKKTIFNRYPYLIIQPEQPSKAIVINQINFIREICPLCYQTYRDELMFADYVLWSHKKFTVFLSGEGDLGRFLNEEVIQKR